jgi:hypothetical protein
VVKGQAWVVQTARIVQVSRGVATPYLRPLYTLVALPKIMYATDVFLNPATRQRRGDTDGHRERAVINRLASIQWWAAILITGAMRMVAADLVEAHANLMLMRVLVDRYRARVALRLPATHPLQKHVQKAVQRRVKRHEAPLHALMHDFNIRPDQRETIAPSRIDPKWQPDSAAVQVYMDGSGMDGQISAAAVLYRNGQIEAEAMLQAGI